MLAYDDVKPISRNEAKSNLHAIRENNARRKIENVLFDRFWYQNREEKQRRERMKKQRVVEENLRKAKEEDLARQKTDTNLHQPADVPTKIIDDRIVRAIMYYIRGSGINPKKL